MSGAAPKIVTREEWRTARVALLAKEKAYTHQRDALRAERQALPWVRVEKEYAFDAPEGRRTLAELFDGRSQLLVKHFMFGPGWKEGCVGCSFEVDHIESALVHLEHHDVSVVAVSRAPLAEIEPFRRRMGWRIPWVSSSGSDFNYDFHVSFTPEQRRSGDAEYNYARGPVESDELPGLSAFYRDASGAVFHTYSVYGRGGEEDLTTYMLLDLMPLGRNEQGNLAEWVRHHDRYGERGRVDERDGRWIAEDAAGGDCCEKRA